MNIDDVGPNMRRCLAWRDAALGREIETEHSFAVLPGMASDLHAIPPGRCVSRQLACVVRLTEIHKRHEMLAGELSPLEIRVAMATGKGADWEEAAGWCLPYIESVEAMKGVANG